MARAKRRTNPHEKMRDLMNGPSVSQCLFVVAKLGVADALAKGPRTPEAIAQQIGARPDPLRRVLRALASQGVFAEDAKGRFRLTPLAQTLRSDRPGSLRDLALMTIDLHDWNDAQCVKLLGHCRDAMAEGGRVLVVEHVIQKGNGGADGKLMDVTMLVVTGGRGRTREEFHDLFARAGLLLARVVPSACPLSILEAVRA